jgi:hypothetical protein
LSKKATLNHTPIQVSFREQELDLKPLLGHFKAFIIFEAQLPVVEDSKKPDLFTSFNPRPFVRSLSYREFLTSFSLALLLIGIQQTVDYLADESTYLGFVYFPAAVFCVAANHIIYRLEHKKQNNFIGRSLHDSIFLLIYGGLRAINTSIMGYRPSFSVSGIWGAIGILIGFVVSVMIFEIVIAVIKLLLLKLGRWQIL